MNEIQLQYKRETGDNPSGQLVEYYENDYGIMTRDDDILELKEEPGWLCVPNLNYIAWLENKVEELQKQHNARTTVNSNA